eukprot:CAMPEP_0170518968 /NCGR_PEP_ID=MMETSP0209-20121228/4536_1 /TAXON_ID=665100 ORGANISM="Litonotus pictus, Strain P1" /NCGR_SAMPLE_ID=MMETSP0209 /ASSEMBLY_ACC=CAM_ASM_000301 /LENGTH=345 /DNA_ID=CAMNT_0010804723 /DNA_START=1419 /DNA_END=2456 /DNA_ORIENTATION=+
MFDYEGKIYVYRTIKEVLCTLADDNQHFVIVANLISLSPVIRDFSYTFCFYSHFILGDREDVIKDSTYCEPTNRVIHILSFIPTLTLNFVQIMKNSIECDTYSVIIMKFLKFFFTYVTVITAFTLRQTQEHWLIWLFSSIWTAVFSFYWDCIDSYGFLNRGKFFLLRPKLAIRPVSLYYALLFADFVMRFVFVLIISPDVVYQFMRPEFLFLTLYFVEVLRRAISNYLTIENYHTISCATFRATQFVPLPLYYSEELRSYQRKEKYEKVPVEEGDRLDQRLRNILNLSQKEISKKKVKTGEEFIQEIRTSERFQFNELLFTRETGRRLDYTMTEIEEKDEERKDK